jgi:hypothetical protein
MANELNREEALAKLQKEVAELSTPAFAAEIQSHLEAATADAMRTHDLILLESQEVAGTRLFP